MNAGTDGTAFSDAPVRHQESRVRMGRGGVRRDCDLRAGRISAVPPSLQPAGDPFDQVDMRR